ncbi:UNVERIFIED_CONTAM: hypothetical protein K2H54_000366 [Gekko kuhli]
MDEECSIPLSITDLHRDVLHCGFQTRWYVLLNENEVHLPHVSASFSVFQPSSYHIIVETNAGLKLQIQLAPMMQLFAIADQSVKGTVQGKYELLSSMEDYSVSELIRGRKLLAAETTESRS